MHPRLPPDTCPSYSLSAEQLQAKCNPGFLHNLWKSLEKVTEETFKYDVDWITSGMGWPLVSPVRL